MLAPAISGGHASDMANFIQILAEIEQGDVAASERLLPLVYDELR